MIKKLSIHAGSGTLEGTKNECFRPFNFDPKKTLVVNDIMLLFVYRCSSNGTKTTDH